MDQKTSNTQQTIASGAIVIGGLLRLQMQRKSGQKSNSEKELEEEHHE